MQIDELNIEGFGVLENTNLYSIGAGLVIVYGLNGSGKTTLQSFLQSLLFSARKQRSNPEYQPHSGGQHKGTVRLRTRLGAAYELRGNFSAAATQDKVKLIPLHGAQQIDREYLVAHAGRELFTSVFSIGLHELQNENMLQQKEIKDLMGGLTGRGVSQTQKKLRAEAENLYKKKGREPLLNKQAKEWKVMEEKRGALIRSQEDCAVLEQKLSEIEQRIRSSEVLLEAAREENSHLLNLEKAWVIWPEYRLLRLEIKEAGILLADFPENAAATLENKLEALKQCHLKLAEAEEELKQQVARVENINEDISALQAAPLIDEMNRSIENFLRIAQEERECNEKLADEKSKAENALRQMLRWEGWTRERITSFALSKDQEVQGRKFAEALLKASAALEQHAGETGQITSPVQLEAQSTLRSAISELQARMVELQQQFSKREAAVTYSELDKALRPLQQQSSLVENRLDEQKRLRSELAAIRSELAKLPSSAAEQVSWHEGQEREADRLDAALLNATERYEEAGDQVLQCRRAVEQKQAELAELEQAEAEKPLSNVKTLSNRADQIAEALVQVKHRDVLRNRLNELKGIENSTGDGKKTARMQLPAGIVLALLGAIVAFALHSTMLFLLLGILLALAGAALTALSVRSSQTANTMAPTAQTLQNVQQELEAVNKTCMNMQQALQIELTLAELQEESERLRAERDKLLEAGDGLSQVKILQLKQNDLKEQEKIAQQKLEECKLKMQAAQKNWHTLMKNIGLQETASLNDALRCLQQKKRESELCQKEKQIESRAREIEEKLEACRLKVKEAANLLNKELPAAEHLLEFVAECNQFLEELGSAEKHEEDLRQQYKQYETEMNGKQEQLKILEETFHKEGLQQEEALRRQEEAKTSWQSWLKNLGLPGGWMPDEALEFVDLYHAAQSCLQQVESAAARCTKLHIQLQEMADKADRVALLLEDQPGGVTGFKEAVIRCSERLQNARNAEQIKQSIQESIGIGMRKCEEYKRKITDAEQEKQKLLHLYGVETVEQLNQKVELLREMQGNKERLRTLQIQLEGYSAPGKDVELLIEELELLNSITIQQKLENNRSKIEHQKAEIGRLQSEKGSVAQKLEDIALDLRMETLQQEEENLAASMRQLTEQWLTYKLAELLMEEARKEYEKKQPQVMRHASSFLNTMTCGEYTELRSVLNQETPLIIDRNGRPKQMPGNRALQDVVYLALRMAMIRQWNEEHEPLPVILDDVLVNCDKEMQHGAASAVAELAKTCQLFYLTCHAETEQLLRKHAPDCDYVLLENGKLKRSAT